MKKEKRIWKIGRYVVGKGYEILNSAGKRIGWTDKKTGLWMLDECLEIWRLKR